MKRLKLIVGMLCASVFLACMGLFAACGETASYYTVTAEYDGRGGTVEISAPASPQGYVKDESVTITVTAKTNFVVGEVMVNGTAATLDAQGKYTFKVADNTTVSAMFYNAYDGWRGMVWTDTGYGSTAGLGTLKFTAEGGMTLTPPSGEATPVTIKTAGVDLTKGLPDKQIDVEVGGKEYKVSFGAGITFKEDYTEHVFDSPSLTGFSAYEGEWTQHHNDPELAASLTVTADSLVYTYAGGTSDTYASYYTATDGTYYLKNQIGSGKPMRSPFGYFDNAKKVIYVDLNGSMQYFTADGTLPKAAIPAEFYGQWSNETYQQMTITANSATILSAPLNAFAVIGAGKEAIVYIYQSGGYYTLRIQSNAATGEEELVLQQGNNVPFVFEAVKPQPLPADYKGDWTRLGGTATISVDDAGTFTYQGKVYATTYETAGDNGFWHFITDAGYPATISVCTGNYVLMLDDGNGTITYFTKAAASTLPDLSVSGEIADGTYTAGNMTITVAGGKMTLAIGGESAALQVLFGESVVMDDVQQYVGGAIWKDTYYGIKYNKSTGTLSLFKNIDLDARTETAAQTETAFTRGGAV